MIVGKCFQQHLSNLELVLDRLRQAGLRLKTSKCHLFCEKVTFLGHRISRQGNSTDPKRFLRFRTGRPQIQCKMSDSSLVLWDTTGNTFPILLPLPDRYTNLPSEVVSFNGHKSVSMHLMNSNRDYCLPPYYRFQTLRSLLSLIQMPVSMV